MFIYFEGHAKYRTEIWFIIVFMSDITIEKIHFAVFVIDAMSEKWGLSTNKTYRILNESGVMDGYILDLYDVVHTLGREAIVEELARENGLSAKDALGKYYTSEICSASNDDMEEILYLAPQVLVKML